ncbi:MAG TPA: hypothetical protein VLI94_12675 [Solirubrobacterales bacterium]|nr:hypothetical protein [Solirubrobacterales bacterium]
MTDLFAISATGGQGQLTSINLGGSIASVANLGNGGGAGLAYRPASSTMYAIRRGPAEPALQTISLTGQAQTLGSLPVGLDGGLAYHNPSDRLFALSNQVPGAPSMLHQINLDGTSFPLFQTPGPTWGALFYEPLRDRFFALGTDSSKFSWIYELTLGGTLVKLFGVGYRAKGGLAYGRHQDTFYFVGYDTETDPNAHLHSLRLNGDVRHVMNLGAGFDEGSLQASPWFGGRIQITSPLPSERFLTAETPHFDAAVLDGSGNTLANSTGLEWSSNIDGVLGQGPIDHKLTAGTHSVTLSGHGLSQTYPVRVYSDLGGLYSAQPAPAELSRIQRDFTFNWLDGTPGVPAEAWASFPGFPFDQNSSDPSRTAVLAKLDVLRHQRFDQPPPFSEGLTLYDFVKSHTHTINAGLGTGANMAGGGVINLNRNFALWQNPYVDSLYLLLHENRHNQAGDAGHTSCTSWTGGAGTPGGMDPAFEPGSGYAYASLYLMWLFKHSLFDPPETKSRARDLAIIFRDRFCTRPSSANPAIQSLLVELWNV